MLKNHIQLKCLLSTLCIVLFTGCASTSKTSNNDPHEPINRKIYAFNDTLDKKFIEPVAEKYEQGAALACHCREVGAKESAIESLIRRKRSRGRSRQTSKQKPP